MNQSIKLLGVRFYVKRLTRKINCIYCKYYIKLNFRHALNIEELLFFLNTTPSIKI